MEGKIINAVKGLKLAGKKQKPDTQGVQELTEANDVGTRLKRLLE